MAEHRAAFLHAFRREPVSPACRHHRPVFREWPSSVSASPSNGFGWRFSDRRLRRRLMRVLLVPAGAGLVVAFLVQRFFRAARSSGVNQTKAAVYVFDGYVPFRTVIGKFRDLLAGDRQRTIARARRSVPADGSGDRFHSRKASETIQGQIEAAGSGGRGGGAGGGV